MSLKGAMFNLSMISGLKKNKTTTESTKNQIINRDKTFKEKKEPMIRII